MRAAFLSLALLGASPARAAAPFGHRGLYGDYHMTRDSSGTSWQPEAAPMEGWHESTGPWRLMAHARGTFGGSEASGPRGRSGLFTTSMLMAQARRDEGPSTLAFRGMFSLEPLMGARGYPLLLQSGETADGRALLIDRQHPHDAIMEISATWAARQDEEHPALFVYGGLPGEPALGPPAFMHRPSAEEDPEAPISHHWQDSTHITEGVVTAGLAFPTLKVEASVFRGREPDQYRWDIEQPKLDSFSGRLSWNPDPRWAFQASAGSLHSPDRLAPGVNTTRMTASAMSFFRLEEGATLASTIVFGLNNDDPGTAKASLLGETTWARRPWAVFGRAEWVQKDELLLALGRDNPLVQAFYPGGIAPLHLPTPDAAAAPAAAVIHAPIYSMGKIGLGVVRDLGASGPVRLGVGAKANVHVIPSGLYGAYGKAPVSAQVWLRAAWVGR